MCTQEKDTVDQTASIAMLNWQSSARGGVAKIFPTWDFESSTSILAAGCVTVILLRIVAPSLVMMTSPSAWHT